MKLLKSWFINRRVDLSPKSSLIKLLIMGALVSCRSYDIESGRWGFRSLNRDGLQAQFPFRKLPGESVCRVVMALPTQDWKRDGDTLVQSISGRVCILKKGKQVQEFLFNKETIEKMGWFPDNAKLVGFMLNSRLILDGYTPCEVVISFDQRPPSQLTLWLFSLNPAGTMLP